MVHPKTSMILEFNAVKKIYPGEPEVVALDSITFGVKPHSLTAIVGPSGSGKSTLLNLASGLDRPTSGSIRIGKLQIEKLTKAELSRFRLNHLGFVFQSYNLFPALTALENVEFPITLRGQSESQVRAKAMKALEAVGLSDKVNSYPLKMSGGQQQRVAVARAIADQPELVFADEPTANLDSKNALQLIDLFVELNQKFGTTFVFSTHDMRLVERVTHRIEIGDGKLKSESFH